MGAESNPLHNHAMTTTTTTSPPPLVVGLQPSALVDHIARVDFSLLSKLPGDPGGSFPVILSSLLFYLLVGFVDYWIVVVFVWLQFCALV